MKRNDYKYSQIIFPSHIKMKAPSLNVVNSIISSPPFRAKSPLPACVPLRNFPRSVPPNPTAGSLHTRQVTQGFLGSAPLPQPSWLGRSLSAPGLLNGLRGLCGEVLRHVSFLLPQRCVLSTFSNKLPAHRTVCYRRKVT